MKRTNKSRMKRCYRIYLNDLNVGKAATLTRFLYLCHDVQQYFIDLFWQRGEMAAGFAALPDVHRAVKRFGITTRLGQALAKQALEAVASQRKKIRSQRTKPELHSHSVALFYHFVTVSQYEGEAFDFVAKLIGSGAPRMTILFRSTKPLNVRLAAGWIMNRTVRFGLKKDRLYIDVIIEKPRPKLKTTGRVVGMDSNYRNGLVFSDRQQVADNLHALIQTFSKRQRNTRRQIKDLLAREIKKLDLSSIRVMAVEDLKRVRNGTRGKFSRTHNRRLSHWLYAYAVDLVGRRSEEAGVRLEGKDPWKTSQHCPACGRWDRRSRKGDRFHCVFCGYTDHADFKAADTLELLELAGLYGLRSLPSSSLLTKCSVSQSFE